MKRLLTSLTCLALVCLAHAQQSGHPGYIVRSAGDTVHGYLKDLFFGDLINEIGFKTHPTDNDFVLYSPDQVKAFQFDEGNAYRSKTFTKPEGNTQQTTYMRLLVAGECELYSFHNKSVLYFLILKDSLAQLMYDDDLLTLPGVKGNFRNVLNFYAVGCESARTGIEKLNYSEPDLMHYVRELDGCLAPDKTAATYFNKAKTHWGFFAYAGGIVLGDNHSQFTGEARLRLTYPQMKANVSFNVGIRYAHVVRNLQDDNYLVAKIYHKTTYGMLSIPFTVQYNFTRGIVQPYLFAGLAAMRSNITSDDPYQSYIVDDSYYNKWSLSGSVGGGVEVSLTHFLQARLEWRYEDFAQYPTVGLSVRF